MIPVQSFRYLAGPDDPAFADVVRIYHASFDLASREPDERLVQELRGEYRLPFRFLILEAPHVVGFARYCTLPADGFGFLLHIAIDADDRGRGLGSVLLQRVLDDCQPMPLLAEIDREGPVRRWYEREGFSVVTETYTQPSVRPETGPVPYALVSSKPCADRQATIEKFYATVWELPPNHSFVIGAVAG